MTLNSDDDTLATPIEVDRRKMMRRAGLGIVGGAALVSGLVSKSSSANATNQSAGPPDADIFNFALNLEYLEAEFYLYAATGQGLSQADRSGSVGVQGPVNAGMAVPFKSSAIQQYAQRIAVDELAHVRFIRAVLGSSAVAEPNIDVSIGPNSSFSKLAVAAGLIVQGQTFNPYADDISFLLGASIFEDVGVTAYAGAARYIGNPNYVEAAAAILAVEAYHSGAIRTLLSDIGAGVAFNAIAQLRGKLNGVQNDIGILIPGNDYNFLPTDVNSLVFRRTTTQVLQVVYGTPAASPAPGLFFPAGMNGNIR
jgi:hypothetical protein